MSSQEILNELIAMERNNIVDDDKVSNLLAALRINLNELPVTDVFSLIHNSHDLEEDEAYWACIHNLRGRPEEAVFEKCCEWANDVSVDRRQAAAQILAQLGYASEYPFAQRSLPILSKLLSDTDLDVIDATLYAFGHLKIGNPEELVKFVSHDDSNIRCATASALGGREDKVSIDGMIKLSNDGDREVRDWATFYLDWLDEIVDPEIDKALFDRLLETDTEIRGQALIGLARRNNLKVLELLKSELAGEFHGSWCIEAAAKMKLPELKPLLIDLRERLSEANLIAFGNEVEQAVKACSEAQ